MIVYMVTNKVNGKKYIGQTIGSLKQRKQQHIYTTLNKKDNSYFHNAIRKYGIDNFDWEELDSARNIDELNDLEIFFIKLFKTFGNGYNLDLGGRNSLTPKETRKKMSEAQLGEKNHMYGKTGESSPLYGRKKSEAHKRKLSEVRIGKYTGKDNPKARAVVIDNKYFDTRKEAGKFIGVDPTTIRDRILHKTKWFDYQYANN